MEIKPIGMGFSLFGQFAGMSSMSRSGTYLSVCHSYDNPPTDCADWVCERWLEILLRHYRVVYLLHTKQVDLCLTDYQRR